MTNEKVSIIMGVYNCSNTLNEAIDSILMQTYIDWELIICDDGSTDDTYNVLLKYKTLYPDKIIILRNEKNYRLSYSLNKCLKYASGKYIARMDGDDLSAPTRLEKQVSFLRENQRVHLIGTSMQRFNEEGTHNILYSIQNPDKFTLKNKTPFNHATIMTYKHVYDRLGGYTVSERTKRSQDIDLWFRFYKEGFNGRNLTEPLYYVRENYDAIKRRTFKVRFNSYKTRLIGFKMLGYPLYWYIPITFNFLIKSITPYFLISLYRKYQFTHK
ncbi:glycosyltransferase family 2 protein [Salirhabdus salicampi]|uniref:glycosyltransferase family 2 protein n=1 Tax=Salirhabdus salicampi TaxID=476102 RepID=UPI0020C3C1DB|nr:glycosyltransferase [Salirhabdus salicampi]MCP8617522.1 glycosyltransferase [Salirhabdus salicampi]